MAETINEKMTSKVSHDDDHLDFGKLEREVHNAVIKEERYWRENDAKIRAVEQKVGTYDEFREMVMAAHLKPLEKDDKISSMGTFTQVWNQAAGKKQTDTSKGSGSNVNTPLQNSNAPKSGLEFAQHWKRHCKTGEEKRQYLYSVGPGEVSNLFKTEISGGLFGEFLCCLQNFETQDIELVMALLEAFSKSQRFSLSLAFLSKSEKDSCLTLFEKLKANITEDQTDLKERLSTLEKMYLKR